MCLYVGFATEIGMKAATLWKSFKELDKEGNNCLDVHDVVAAFAEIPGVDKKQALEVAYTILEVADDKSAGEDKGTISFTEYMTLLEGSTALNFDDFVALVHTTGNAKKHMKEALTDDKKRQEISEASRFYDSVVNENNTGLSRSASSRGLRRQSTGAIFRAIDSAGEGSLVCSYCSKTVSKELVKVQQKAEDSTKSRIKCPFCKESIVVPRKTMAESISSLASPLTSPSKTKGKGTAPPKSEPSKSVFTPNTNRRMYEGRVEVVDHLTDMTEHDAANEEANRLSSLQSEYMTRIEEKSAKPRRIDQLLMPAESFPRTVKEQQRADAQTRQKPLRTEKSVERLKAMYSNDFWV